MIKRFSIALCLLLILSAISIAEEGKYQGILPEGNALGDWSRVEENFLFEGQTLFRHINGGAELYHDYGFLALLVQDYKSGEKEIRLEIYDMGSADGATGVFGENTEGLTTTKDFGVASSVDDYQIIFHQGQYYVSITCFESSEEMKAAMAKLAEAFIAKIG